MNEIQEYLLKFLRPFTFIVWGFILLMVSWYVAESATRAGGSFFLRHAFAFTLVSWVAGLLLLVRLTLRRRRRDPGLFG